MSTEISATDLAFILWFGDATEEGCDLPPAAMRELQLRGDVNRASPGAWERAVSQLGKHDLSRLLKALVILDGHHETWRAGSVAGAIWVYGVFQSRFPKNAPKMADWMLSNTKNRHIPFARDNFGAKTFKEYEVRRKLDEKRSQEGAAKQLADKRAAEARQKLRATAELERAAARKEKSRARKLELEKLERLPIADRLRFLAGDSSRPLQYYPVDWANAVTDGEIRRLSLDDRKRLIGRCSKRREGSWRILGERLRGMASD